MASNFVNVNGGSVKKVVFMVFAVVILLLVLGGVFGSFTTVEAGERGVVLNWGAFSGQIMDPGLHFKIPFVQNVVKINVQTQKLAIEKSQAYSHDLQVVDVQSALNYNIDPKEVGLLYAEIGDDYESKIITPVLEASVKQIYAKYIAEELLTKRSEVQDEIEQVVRKTIEGKHIIVQHYSLVNESFSQDYEKSIEQKQIAEQSALKAKNDLDRIKIEADQQIAAAKGKAESLKVEQEALSNKPEVLQLRAIEKWNGQLPTYLGSGAPIPFLGTTAVGK